MGEEEKVEELPNVRHYTVHWVQQACPGWTAAGVKGELKSPGARGRDCCDSGGWSEGGRHPTDIVDVHFNSSPTTT